MSNPDWLALLDEIADRSDEISMRFFRRVDLRVESKPDRSLVTEADRDVETAARELVAARFPHLGVYGEEQGEQAGSSSTRLIIDPIDSTANFVRGIPVFATLLAIEHEGEIVAGVASAPALVTRWRASRGGGTWQGERRLHVSGIAELGPAQLFHGSLGGYEGQRIPAGLLKLAQSTHRQRGFGDFWQHCLVAAGSGEIAIDPLVAPWDIAALQILVEEAGGRATTLEGKRTIYGGSLVSSNGRMHDEVLALLAG